MTPAEKAASIAAAARDKLRAYDWSIQRPTDPEPWRLHVQPAQDFEWVAKHYPGAKITQWAK